MNNREKIDQLKEEYKTHYRAMHETSRKVNAARRKSSIVSALKSMDAQEVFHSMESAMDSLREKMAKTEAKVEVLLENWFDEEENAPDIQEFEEQERRKKAQETIKHIRSLTRRYESDLDNLIEHLEATKTLGASSEAKNRKAGETGGNDE